MSKFAGFHHFSRLLYQILLLFRCKPNISLAFLALIIMSSKGTNQSTVNSSIVVGYNFDTEEEVWGASCALLARKSILVSLQPLRPSQRLLPDSGVFSPNSRGNYRGHYSSSWNAKIASKIKGFIYRSILRMYLDTLAMYFDVLWQSILMESEWNLDIVCCDWMYSKVFECFKIHFECILLHLQCVLIHSECIMIHFGWILNVFLIKTFNNFNTKYFDEICMYFDTF